MSDRRTAVVVGVGARARLRPAQAVRTGEHGRGDGVQVHLDQLLQEELIAGARTCACDATDQRSVDRPIEEAGKDLGAPELVVLDAGAFGS